MEGPKDGRELQTCQYQGNTGAFQVQLVANRYNVKAYELHTGELAFQTKVDSSSGGCPSILEWQCSTFNPNCPPPGNVRASHSDDAIRSAVQPWVFQ